MEMKTYCKAEIEVFAISTQYSLLAGSGQQETKIPIGEGQPDGWLSKENTVWEAEENKE